MKLYEVEFTWRIYARGEDEDDAIEAARDGVREDEPEVIRAYEVANIKLVSPNWKDSIPYGGDDDLTVAEFLNPIPKDKP